MSTMHFWGTPVFPEHERHYLDPESIFDITKAGRLARRQAGKLSNQISFMRKNLIHRKVFLGNIYVWI